MSTLAQIGHGLERAWGSLSEGWQQLRQRASDAITRFNPLSGRGELETADEQLMQRASRWGVMAADIEEHDDELVVRLEAPGMEPDDFDLSVIDDILVVRGEKQLQRERRHGCFHVMECAYGSFERAIPLPKRVDESGARAKYRRGVLTVRMPVAASARSRRITVQV